MDFLGQDHLVLAALAGGDAVAHEAALRVQLRVGLGDDVLLFLERRQVDRIGLDHDAVLDLAVGRLDEAELVDLRVRRERGDEPDVRTFRRLDGADAPVVGRVHVAHLEPRPLAAEPARAERGEPPLVRQLGERVGLVHELAELGGAEELLHHRRHRLGVDEVVRHQVGDVGDRHPLLDRPLHARQAHPELVLEQLAHRSHAPVAEVIDVVGGLAPELDLEQMAHHVHHVLAPQRLDVQVGADPELLVDHEPADAREVVAARVHEHAAEERPRRVHRGGIARAQPPVDLDQRLVGVLEVILLEGVGDRQVGLAGHHHEQLEGRHLPREHLRDDHGGDVVVGLGENLAGLRVHDAAQGAPGGQARERVRLDLDPVDAALEQPLDEPRRQGLARPRDRLLLPRGPQVLEGLGPGVGFRGQGGASRPRDGVPPPWREPRGGHRRVPARGFP